MGHHLLSGHGLSLSLALSASPWWFILALGFGGALGYPLGLPRHLETGKQLLADQP